MSFILAKNQNPSPKYSNEQLEIIKDVSEIYNWIAIPTDNLDKYLNLIKKYHFPLTIIIYKIIQLLKKNNMSEQEIFDYITNNIVDVTANNKLKDMLIGTIQTVDQNKHNREWKSYELLHLVSNSKFITQNVHTFMPHPDPIKGRPCIGFTECYYYKCHKKFKSGEELLTHLYSTKDFSHGYHLYHEHAVRGRKLTPKIIKEQDIIVCPSVYCGKIFVTPDNLCLHLKQLGINPFFDTNENNTEFINSFNKDEIVVDIKNIFQAESCIICCNSQTEILFGPCMHSSMCFTCFLKYNNKECPECRAHIDILLPI